jgi:hypothetical protein
MKEMYRQAFKGKITTLGVCETYIGVRNLPITTLGLDRAVRMFNMTHHERAQLLTQTGFIY